MKVTSFVMGLAVAATLAVPALADGINARIKSVDPTAHTITVVEHKQDYVFAVNDGTKFVNSKGEAVAEGINSGDLKPGTRLSITYTKQDDKSIASEVKLRDVPKDQK
jgi:hypothetical protein